MSNDESSWKCPFAHDGNSPMRLGTVPSGHVSVSEAILHFAGHVREAAVWGKLGTSWDRFRLRPELPSPASAPLCQRSHQLLGPASWPPGHPALPEGSHTWARQKSHLPVKLWFSWPCGASLWAFSLVGGNVLRLSWPHCYGFPPSTGGKTVQRSHRAFVRCGELGHPSLGWRGLSGSTPARCWPSAPPPSSRRRWLTASRASCGCCLGLRRRCCSRDGLQHSV